MPNVIAESQRLKMIELDNAARAVGVAVQSKLYGLKNAATVSEGSYYSFLNDSVAAETDIHLTSQQDDDAAETDIHLTSQQDDDAAEAVKYITNFEETEDKRGALGKKFFFSGFLTDTELLEQGYIVLFYKPATGDVVEVFYSEKPIALRGEGRDAGLIDFLERNAISQEYLELNKIGHYFGYGVEEPVRLNGMPLFTCNWVWDDELRLEIEMLTQPAEELLDVPLGLELYLEFPALDGSEKSTEEMMIYAEGIFGSQYDATRAQSGYVTGLSAVISPDTPLTLREIQNHGGLLNFALDSRVTDSVSDYQTTDYNNEPYGNHTVKKFLYKQNYVGVAIGDPNAETGENATAGKAIQNTTFTNCAASIFLINAAYDPAARVVYAGGLVGIAMGDVTIQNSYAASMLSAYYAGGLVGATVSNASWKFTGGTYLGVLFTGSGTVTTAPKIQNSFSAGLIMRQVRIGAGLIADLQGTAPQVSGCYSASWWEAISPVAYGTFKGDKQNYYVYQTRFAVPVTSNVEAWFAAEGDVLSLQSGDHGIACTGGDLAEKLKNAGWTAAPTLEKTHQWSPGNGHERYRESSNEYPGWPNAWNGHGKPEPYPFPMPEGNAELWGDWIRNGTYVKETTGTGAIPKFSVKKFMDYFCTYYQSSDGGNLRNDVTQIASRDDYANIAIRRYGSLSRDYAGSCELRRRRFQIQGNKVTLTTNTTVDQHEDWDWVLSSDGTGLDALEYWWAEGANPNGSLAATNWGNPETQKRGYNVGGSRKVPGDVVGVTNASGNNGNFVFTAPKFYDPDFNPIKDYTFALEEGKIVLRHTKDGKNVDDLLFAGVSYGNLSVTALKFQRADAAISIEIAVSFGAKELWRGDAGVKPLNGLSD